MPCDETRDFYARHCATPGGVVVLTIIDDDSDETEIQGVFSSLEKASKWSDQYSRDNPDKDLSCLFVPYIIDEPDYGNVEGH